MVVIVRLNRSTIAVFLSLSLTKCWIPWRIITACQFELKSSLLLSVCFRRKWPWFAAVNTWSNAAVIALEFWNIPALPRRTWSKPKPRWAGTSFHRFACRYPAYRPCLPATEHWSPLHTCGFNWAPACAAYRPVRSSGFLYLLFLLIAWSMKMPGAPQKPLNFIYRIRII